MLKKQLRSDFFSDINMKAMIQMLQKHQKKRLGYEEGSDEVMKSHPFFSDVNWKRMESEHYTPPFLLRMTGTVHCTVRPVSIL